MKIQCPKCGSTKYTYARCIGGFIKCNDCGFLVENSQIDKSFFVNEENTIEKKDD